MLSNPVKSILNVLVWPILAIGLSACSMIRPLQCETQPVSRVPLDLAQPDVLQLTPVRWRVITPENAEQIWREMQESGNEAVVFAITPRGYEQLSLDFAAIRNHIAQQRTVIMKYKEYYENVTP